MRKGLKNKSRSKDFNIPVWILDGMTGVLALVIYDFLLYILTSIGIRGFVSELQDVMGYFGLNTFVDLGFNAGEMFLGILIFFIIAFLLGVGIGNKVRKRKLK